MDEQQFGPFNKASLQAVAKALNATIKGLSPRLNHRDWSNAKLEREILKVYNYLVEPGDKVKLGQKLVVSAAPSVLDVLRHLDFFRQSIFGEELPADDYGVDFEFLKRLNVSLPKGVMGGGLKRARRSIILQMITALVHEERFTPLDITEMIADALSDTPYTAPKQAISHLLRVVQLDDERNPINKIAEIDYETKIVRFKKKKSTYNKKTAKSKEE